MSKRVSILIDDELHKTLKHLAIDNNLSLKDIIEQLIHEGLKVYKDTKDIKE